MSKNTSKNRLFPFAVRDIQDFRMEIGQDKPKQKIVSASSKSVIIVNFLSRSQVPMPFTFDGGNPEEALEIPLP